MPPRSTSKRQSECNAVKGKEHDNNDNDGNDGDDCENDYNNLHGNLHGTSTDNEEGEELRNQ